ncbi:hypothetical protein K8I61_11250 [bacterium]|nr:hypothetical protein [bacterium]
MSFDDDDTRHRPIIRKPERGPEGDTQGEAARRIVPPRDPELDRPIFRRPQESAPAQPERPVRRAIRPSDLPSHPDRLGGSRASTSPWPNSPSRPGAPATIAPTRQISQTRSVPTHASVSRNRAMQANLAPLPFKSLATGIAALDQRTGGLAAGTFNALAGQEGEIRSHIASFIARNVVADGGRVLAFVSPFEASYWTPMPGLSVETSISHSLDSILDAVSQAQRLDLLVIDPLHGIETPRERDRIAAMDEAIAMLIDAARAKRATILAATHLSDRAAHHGGVSMHPWMFKDVSCLIDLSALVLMQRQQRSGRREILVYRRGVTNRVGSLPSFVLPLNL